MQGDATPAGKGLTSADADACTSACTSGAENGPNQADRLAVIADLLADLPAEQRAEVIAELAPAERAAVAQLLIGIRSGQADEGGVK